MAATPRPESTDSRFAPAAASVPASAHGRALVAALAMDDPMRAPLDRAVRSFVRTERSAGHDLDDVLAELRTLLRDHVEPPLPAETRAALREAAAWFAVSEYYRAD